MVRGITVDTRLPQIGGQSGHSDGLAGLRGFTVIEVMIFLAISGMLLFAALASVSSSLRNARFEDDVRSTETFIQAQYSEVASGRNIRSNSLTCSSGTVSSGSSVPGTSSCIVLGRLLAFDIGGNRVTSRYIVADGTATMSGFTETDKVMSLGPRVVNDSLLNSSFVNPWGGEYQKMVDVTNINVNSLAIMRSPDTGRMLIYSQPVASLTGSATVTFQETQLNRRSDLCVYSSELLGGGRKAYVTISAGQGQNVIQANFDTPGGAC